MELILDNDLVIMIIVIYFVCFNCFIKLVIICLNEKCD